MAGELVTEAAFVFPNSAGVGTPIDVAVPPDQDMNVGADEQRYEISVRNPSTITALTVRVKTLEKQDAATGGGADRYPEVTNFPVLVNSPEGKTQVVEGWDLSRGGRITVSNDTILGGAQGFTGDLRVRRL